MKVRRPGKPHRRAACAILQLLCCTHRVTEPVSMPALSTLSLLSTAVSGLVNVAGQAAEALHNAKTGSAKKSDPPNQTQDASQLAGVFAAYLAAVYAAAGTTSSTTASPNMARKGQGKSTKEEALSLLPLSVMLAAGPTMALTTAVALRCTPVGGTASASKTIPIASALPGTASAVSPAKQPADPGAKTKGTQTIPLARGSESKALTSAKGVQAVLNGGRPFSEPSQLGRPSSSSPGAFSAPGQETATEVPVLALHDVPGPNVQDHSHPAVVSTASWSDERSAPAGLSSTPSSADPDRSPSKALPVSAVLLQAQATQTKLAVEVGSGHGPTLATTASGGSVSPAARSDSPQQTTSPPSSAPSSVLPPTIAAVSVSPLTGNTTSATANNAQTNVPVAEQLSRALVAQASVVAQEGRTDFHLRLEPPQLGSVQIHLTTTDHNTISARIIVAQEGTRQLIEGQVHQLRQALAESGVVLGTFDVTRDGGGFAQGGHRQPPEPPPPAPLPTQSAAPTATQSVGAKVVQTVSTDGIDLLA
jgi:flagellar hook-length control protein FliK